METFDNRRQSRDDLLPDYTQSVVRQWKTDYKVFAAEWSDAHGLLATVGKDRESGAAHSHPFRNESRGI